MTKSDILLKLKDLKPVLSEKYGLTTLALFGSYSREENTDVSDIDLMIDLATPDVNRFFNCAFELQDSFKGKKVEIVTKGGIKPKYFDAIKEDLLYV